MNNFNCNPINEQLSECACRAFNIINKWILVELCLLAYTLTPFVRFILICFSKFSGKIADVCIIYALRMQVAWISREKETLAQRLYKNKTLPAHAKTATHKWMESVTGNEQIGRGSVPMNLSLLCWTFFRCFGHNTYNVSHNTKN